MATKKAASRKVVGKNTTSGKAGKTTAAKAATKATGKTTTRIAGKKAVTRTAASAASKKPAAKTVVRKVKPVVSNPVAKKMTAGPGNAAKASPASTTSVKATRPAPAPQAAKAGAAAAVSRSGKSPAAAKSTASAAKKKSGAAPKKITPRQALKNTQALLEAKHERERTPPSWQAIGSAHNGTVPHSGFQSDEARVHATELHKEEMDLDAIQGNISSRDRRKQGKRDAR